jgi:hypothetical protein
MKSNRLVLFKEIIAIYSENCKKTISKNALFIVKPGDALKLLWLLKG